MFEYPLVLYLAIIAIAYSVVVGINVIMYHRAIPSVDIHDVYNQDVFIYLINGIDDIDIDLASPATYFVTDNGSVYRIIDRRLHKVYDNVKNLFFKDILFIFGLGSVESPTITEDTCKKVYAVILGYVAARWVYGNTSTITTIDVCDTLNSIFGISLETSEANYYIDSLVAMGVVFKNSMVTKDIDIFNIHIVKHAFKDLHVTSRRDEVMTKDQLSAYVTHAYVQLGGVIHE